MSQILIISGPTATGKTALALQLAKVLNGELVSADSRQVYIGMDIVTGKDLPANSKFQATSLKWKDRHLSNYDVDGVKVWLYDVVYPNESFNVSFWHACATLAISDIHSRGKLPIVVGSTGLYIKSLTHNLDNISVAPNLSLRQKLANYSPGKLYSYLAKLDPIKAASLNISDKANPRRLLRAIEIALSPPSLFQREGWGESYQVSLTCPKDLLYDRIDQRVLARISAGAEAEARTLSAKYGWDVPGLRTSGYMVWQDYFQGKSTLEEVIKKWQTAEHHDARHQALWFTKHPANLAVDISNVSLPEIVQGWYNKLHDQKS